MEVVERHSNLVSRDQSIEGERLNALVNYQLEQEGVQG
jgi:hypothetical protein